MIKYNLNLGGSGGLKDCGTVIVEEDTFVFNADAAIEITIQHDYELSGDTLTLISDDAEVEWDFDSDGVDDPVVLTMVLKHGNAILLTQFSISTSAFRYCRIQGFWMMKLLEFGAIAYPMRGETQHSNRIGENSWKWSSVALRMQN